MLPFVRARRAVECFPSADTLVGLLHGALTRSSVSVFHEVIALLSGPSVSFSPLYTLAEQSVLDVSIC